ncbi:STT3 domain-containing protein [Thermococcus barophilus]|uniref:dolichyl-phosphooligosaccharide-protein glycotransferase n=1 Tax=Thermococcus barophilus (strain DSM 11836 / MP) TaxID=391623 RepID=F0LLZ6_THEBM|nr:STT3 domain-containing protein [Thermococcus barophilus]ADT85095.1 hypothetical protein TERMP_02121 [Thermococcus barophilus MP]
MGNPKILSNYKVHFPLLILTVALGYRIYPYFTQKYLFGFDPYVHLSVIREFLNGNIRDNLIYPLSLAPYGARINEPLGIYYVPILIFKILKLLGLSLYDAFRITPVLFGILTIIFFYSFIAKLHGKKCAIYSVLFLAISFAHISRSMANYYRADNYAVFLFSIVLWAFGALLQKTDFNVHTAFYIATAGIALGISCAFWGGYIALFVFVFGILFFSLVASLLKKGKQHFYSSIYVLLSIISGGVIVFLIGPKVNYHYFQNFSKVFMYPLIFVILLFGFTLLSLRFELSNKAKISTIIIMSIVAVFGVSYYNPTLFKELLTGFGYLNSSGVYRTIMELRRPTPFDLWIGFGISIFLVPFYFLHMKKNSLLFIHLGWIIPSMYLLLNAVRFIFLASLAIAFMAGIGLVEIENIMKSIKFISKKASMAIIMSIFLLTGYLSFASLKNLHPVMDQNWENALLYLKSHSNETDIVLAWWDYGGFIQYYAERPTLTDSVYGQVMAKYVARYYLGLVPTQELKRRGVKYVIVNKELILKFGTIIRTANESGGYLMVMLPLDYTLGNTLVFSNHNIIFVLKRDGEWLGTLQIGGRKIKISRLLVESNDIKEVQLDKDGLILYANLNYGYAVVMDEKAFNTKFSQLMFRNKGDLIYSDGGTIKIFRI